MAASLRLYDAVRMVFAGSGKRGRSASVHGSMHEEDGCKPREGFTRTPYGCYENRAGCGNGDDGVWRQDPDLKEQD